MRHRARHLHRTILNYVREELELLSWITEDRAPFGATPVTLIDYEPVEAGKTPAYNTVAVSLGDQTAEEEEELGGMTSVAWAVFVDIYPDSEPIGIAIAEDIRDCLNNLVIPLLDFTYEADGTDSGQQIVFEDTLVEVVPTATTTIDKRSWRSVKTTARVYAT